MEAGWWTREGSIGGQGCGLIFERLILDIIPAKEKLVGVTRTNDFICNNLINGLPPIAHKYRTRCNGKPSAMSSRGRGRRRPLVLFQ